VGEATASSASPLIATGGDAEDDLVRHLGHEIVDVGLPRPDGYRSALPRWRDVHLLSVRPDVSDRLQAVGTYRHQATSSMAGAAEISPVTVSSLSGSS
jgi:hypothetical protein